MLPVRVAISISIAIAIAIKQLQFTSGVLRGRNWCGAVNGSLVCVACPNCNFNCNCNCNYNNCNSLRLCSELETGAELLTGA